VILFPSVDDVKIINEIRGSGFGQYMATSPYLSGIQTTGATGIVGDVVFYSQGQPCVTFNQVSDPETLSIVVKTLNQQHSNTYIGNGETKEQQSIDQPRAESTEPTTIRQDEQSPVICIKCGNKNPIGALFCNNCGSPLSSPNCSKCGHTNPTGALFCGQCGSKLH
jgi:ribosomal protein L40E